VPFVVALVQVVCDPDRAATFAVAEKLRGEFVSGVTGLVRPLARRGCERLDKLPGHHRLGEPNRDLLAYRRCRMQ